MKICRQLFLWICLLISSCCFAAKPIVIFTDASFDDLIAIGILIKSREVDIKGIVVEGDGWSKPPYGTDNIAKLLGLLDNCLPLVTGAAEPMLSEVTLTKGDHNMADDLWGTSINASPCPILKEDAIVQLQNWLRASSQQVECLVLSPCTTLAALLVKDPAITEKISRVIFSGSVRLHGGDKLPDNFYLDAAASEIVLGSNLPILFVTDQAAMASPINEMYVNLIVGVPTPLATFSHELLTNLLKIEKKRVYGWDVVTAFVLLDPSIIAHKEPLGVFRGIKNRGELVTAIHIDPLNKKLFTIMRKGSN